MSGKRMWMRPELKQWVRTYLDTPGRHGTRISSLFTWDCTDEGYGYWSDANANAKSHHITRLMEMVRKNEEFFPF